MALFLTSPALHRARRFWQDIAQINNAVAARLNAPKAELWHIQLTIREDIGKDFPFMLRRIMAFTLELLALPRVPEDGQVGPVSAKQLKQFLEGGNTVMDDKLGDEQCRARSDELLMENLNAAWLGLYFLGVPFIHPWEKVRRLADYRGGFPSGGCIGKYIGDVYRLARHRMALPDAPAPRFSWPGHRRGSEDSAVLVLSHTPMVLLQEALIYTNDTHATPNSVHELGRRYALLQMMLYIRCGHPVHFFIPVSALREALNKLAKYPDDPEQKPTFGERRRRVKIKKEIWSWLVNTIFPEDAVPGQSVRVLKYPLDTSGMPTCVLGTKTGLYTLESGGAGLHFAGNEIRDSLLGSYRDKLKKVLELSGGASPAPGVDARAISLLGLDKIEFKKAMKGV